MVRNEPWCVSQACQICHLKQLPTSVAQSLSQLWKGFPNEHELMVFLDEYGEANGEGVEWSRVGKRHHWHASVSFQYVLVQGVADRFSIYGLL